MNRRGFLGMLVAAVTIPFTGLPKGPIVSNGWKGLPPAVPMKGALSIPYSCLPPNVYIRGPKYRVVFDRIVLPHVPVPYPKVTNDCT